MGSLACQVVVIGGDRALAMRMAKVGDLFPDFEITAFDSPQAWLQDRPADAQVSLVFLLLPIPASLLGEEIRLLKPAAGEAPILAIIEDLPPAETECLIRSGAGACLRLADSLEEWADAIRRVQAGEIYISHALTSGLLKHVLHTDPGQPGENCVSSLTDRELVVFELVGRGLKPQAIALRLHVSSKTIESHREKIKHRLGFHDVATLTHFACSWVQRHKWSPNGSGNREIPGDSHGLDRPPFRQEGSLR